MVTWDLSFHFLNAVKFFLRWQEAYSIILPQIKLFYQNNLKLKVRVEKKM